MKARLRSAVLAAIVTCGWSCALLAQVETSQDPMDMQRSRDAFLKAKKDKIYYTKEFDLDALPEYHPLAPMSGKIRQWGSNYLADSHLAEYLEAGFRRYHPDVTFEDNLASTFTGMSSLYMERADVAAMGRKASWEELQAYQRVMKARPVEIAMATGSLDVEGWTFALAVFVNENNPLTQLSLEQLDGVFGAERDGGWKGNEWDPSAARGADKNIRSWGQLGLTGKWKDQPIHIYGYNLNYHFPRDFAEKVMGGGYKWNEQLHEFSNLAPVGGGPLISAGSQMARKLAADPYGITYAAMRHQIPGLKMLALANSRSGPFVLPTLDTVFSRQYPLSREVYYYTNRPEGGVIDPLINEYLRYVLSREGQQAVQRDGKYLPLNAELVKAQLRKLN